MCPWCRDANDDTWSPNLCRMHQAENEGLTENQLDRRDRDQEAEYQDTRG